MSVMPTLCRRIKDRKCGRVTAAAGLAAGVCGVPPYGGMVPEYGTAAAGLAAGVAAFMELINNFPLFIINY